MRENVLEIDASDESVIHFYSDMVYRLAFARSGNRQDADEVYQEVFLRYLKKQVSFTEEEHRKAWLIRVTINCAHTLWRSAWRRKTEGLDESMVLETPEDQSLYLELSKLPANYREIIHLYYYENLNCEEIGRLLKRKSATVRTQLTRARALLKNILEEDDYV